MHHRPKFAARSQPPDFGAHTHKVRARRTRRLPAARGVNTPKSTLYIYVRVNSSFANSVLHRTPTSEAFAAFEPLRCERIICALAWKFNIKVYGIYGAPRVAFY